MKVRPVIVLALALFLALAAVYFARLWLTHQSGSTAEIKAPVVQVVAAATALKFGDRLAAENLRLIDWPAGSVPEGTFKTLDELLGPQPRVALQSIQPNELILNNKITGPGQRASLSAVISTGMRAMTIRVNDVLGVAGFVLPGDRVDIMLTREVVQNNPITDVLLQNVKVLGIDQKSDQQNNAPDVVKAVTIEVTTEQAQKITLAATVGKLSLALRDISNVELTPVKPVSIKDLGVAEAIGTVDPKPEDKKVEKPVVKIVRKKGNDLPSIGITRGTARQEYKVNSEGTVLRPSAPPEPERKDAEEAPNLTPPPLKTPAAMPNAAATSS
ncbi:MAG TPA: Flp pilus assembly protein CpaB [Dongiaceae bacterium]